MRLIDADKLVKAIENENQGLSISGAIEKFARTAQVNMQPTVDAIPVEWILKWANRNCMYCYDYDYQTEKTDGWFDINNMVKDWAKENE